MPTNSTPLPLEARTASELSRLARATRPDVARESLKVLARRRDETTDDLAGDLLLHHADQDVRATAAVVLGRTATDFSNATLIEALADPNPTVRRRVAQSLGRIGDVIALRALQRIAAPEQTPVGRAVVTALVMLSYRLGIPEHLIDPAGSGLANVRVGRGDTIDWGSKVRRSTTSIAADAARDLPGIELDASMLISFVCAGQPGAFVANRAFTSADTGERFTRPTVAGALLRDRVCSERYSLDAYLLVDDRDDTGGRAAHLWLMRPDGTLLHHGRVTTNGADVEFTITESNAPYSRPVRIDGTFNRERSEMSVATALVGKPRADSPAASRPATRRKQPA